MQDISEKDIWEDDLLGYEDVAQTFTRLIKTIDDTKVISIEAGYGRGKTFFRERWARHLEDEGEVVVEVDAHVSDHTGDPVLTFIGALIDKLPASDTPKRDAVFEKGKKVLGVLARTGGGILARQGAGALVDYISGEVADELEGQEGLQKHVDAFGDALSKKAGTLIAAQIEAERVRTTELPQQMDALRQALTGEEEGDEAKRIVVLVDELDRCHPDYAIAFLEAMKLVFNRDGFVFCLMVNAEYLEGLAAHRFGKMQAGERYLDKFIDMRLALPKTKEVVAGATETLFSDLPEGIPYGSGEEFTIGAAAKLAGQLASMSELTIRQVKRIRLRVDLTIRCYSEQPLDYSLLVYLAFRAVISEAGQTFSSAMSKTLSRASLTPEFGKSTDHSVRQDVSDSSARNANDVMRGNFPELATLPEDRYRLPDNQHNPKWAKVCIFLARHYVPDHENALNALRQFEVTGADMSGE
ncbi:NTPase [Tropicibacter sp. R16_0]|uniref:KAP family P-loop NTPase fold protein n=1 Tax=Tropicibacter sp. R16_0 TaxID=2821102 RepID=UPI001ADA9673|nr:P-loop NTPase fold protein [Tropicibacter sp. R16_0]MBO9448802.1 NTPase [Tropicibacter sp. R16_0]